MKDVCSPGGGQDDRAVFRIRNLTRVFRGKVALYVPALNIPRGKLIAIVGESGSGKTTLLETLGLLSPAEETATVGEIEFFPIEGEPGLDYRTLWRNPTLLSMVRSNNLAFMFQNANLIPAFDVKDNIALSSLIQDEEIASAREEARRLVEKLFPASGAQDTSASVLGKAVNELSGGMQQRVAFARAMAKRSRVLFADEPTGNVGSHDADTIFRLVREYVDSDESDEDRLALVPARTAIIVTHNLQLPLHYADQIIVLLRNGYVGCENVFCSSLDEEDRRRWPELEKASKRPLVNVDTDSSYKRSELHLVSVMRSSGGFDSLPVDLEGYLKLDSGSPTILPEVAIGSDGVSAGNSAHQRPLSNNQSGGDTKPRGKNFQKLFRKGHHPDLEWNSHYGLFMFLTLVVSFLAIGIARGGLNRVAEKMNDPFARWLPVRVPHNQQRYILAYADSIKQVFGTDFAVEDATLYGTFGMNMCDVKGDSGFEKNVTLRTIEVDDPMLRDAILKQKICGESLSKDGPSVIVGKKFLQKHGLPERPAFITLGQKVDTTWLPVEFPVAAIVVNLPDDADMICTNYFRMQNFNSAFLPRHTDRLILFTPGDRIKAGRLKERLESFFGEEATVEGPWPYNQSWQKGQSLSVKFADGRDFSKMVSSYHELESRQPFRDDSLKMLVNFKPQRERGEPRFDHIAIYLKNLKHVAGLADLLDTRFSLNVDMAIVEAVKNYDYVTRLTRLLGFAIITLAAIGLTLFIANMMMHHLSTNRIFLGIFMAMGISTNSLHSLYRWRMLRYVSIAILFSYSVAFVLGKYLVGHIPFLMVDYEAVSLYMAFFVAVILIATVVSVQWMVNKFVGYPPGALIYDRIGPGGSAPINGHKSNSQTLRLDYSRVIPTEQTGENYEAK